MISMTQEVQTQEETTSAVIPQVRARRLRLNANIRRMVRETTLDPADFIYPLFIRHGHDLQQPIQSMPGQFQWSIDRLPDETRRIVTLNIPAVILFGIPETKDACGGDNYNPDGIIPRAIRRTRFISTSPTSVCSARTPRLFKSA